MKHAMLLGLLGAAQIYLGAQSGWLGALLVWSGLSFLVVAAGYARLGPGVFGKRAAGSLPAWRVAALLPFFLFAWGLWHAERLLSRENAYDEVAPGVWLGRRPLAGGLPAGVKLVIDMTAEFPLARGVADGCDYTCVPTLDASVPARERFEEALEAVREQRTGIFIHCASGHGRSAMMAAAALLALGQAATPEEAERLVKLARPSVALKPEQRRQLAWVAEEMAKSVANGEPCERS